MVEYRKNRKGVVLSKHELLGSMDRSSELQKQAELDLAENLSRQYSKQSENNQMPKFDIEADHIELEKQVNSDTEDRANSKNMLFGDEAEAEDIFAQYHQLRESQKESIYLKGRKEDENLIQSSDEKPQPRKSIKFGIFGKKPKN